MRIVRTIQEIRHAVRAWRGQDKRIGLVATMGALHEGHLSLLRAAKAACDVTVVSIFLNPLQFAPNEDLAKYPRTFERDRDLLERECADLLFAPSVEEIYPEKIATYVTVEGLQDKLCGRSRPGHFRGVTTVVAKLLHIVQPDVAFFGQKDAVQLTLIRRLVRDLNLPVEIVAGAIVREADGLAMSSRNAYLNREERQAALVLYCTLLRMQAALVQGERNSAALIALGKQVFAAEPTVRIDYLEIVDRHTLDSVSEVDGEALIAVAAYVGATRLIDNLLV